MPIYPVACVLDVDMRLLTGAQVTRELRTRLGSDAPLLAAITGRAEAKFGSPGTFDHVLRKPVNFDALTVLLRRVVRGGWEHLPKA